MVASKQGDSLRVAQFERHQQGDRLQGEVAPVHVVSHEQKVGVWRFAHDHEDLHEVMELSVDVTADRNRGGHGHDVGLLLEHLSDFHANVSDFGFCQLFHFEQSLDLAV